MKNTQLFCCMFVLLQRFAGAEPAMAGQFYPADPEELSRMVDGFF